MVELLGVEYVIEHALTDIDERTKAQAYRAYMAECLRLLVENVATVTTGKYISAKWADICDNKNKEDDNRTGDEIAADVIKHIGLSFGGDSTNGFDGTESKVDP